MNTTEEAQKIWKALKATVDREIDSRTRSCMRTKNMTVTTVYNSVTGLIGVKEAFGNEIFLPVYSNLNASGLTAGTAVWVMMPYSSMNNAIVFMAGKG